MEKQTQAIARAAKAHEGQLYADQPYLVHLIAVVVNLQRFGVATPELVVAGYLHDSVEDTALTIADVREEFGDIVAELVYAVTSEPGKNRKERNARTYPKIAAIPGAVQLKLADRIANVESCWSSRDPKLFMYQREYRDFRQALRDVSDAYNMPMWNHLDSLLGWREEK